MQTRLELIVMREMAVDQPLSGRLLNVLSICQTKAHQLAPSDEP